MNSLKNRQKILDNFLKICIIDGWSNQSLKEAAAKSGFKDGDELLIFEDGIYSLIDFYFEIGNNEFRKKAEQLELEDLKIRDKIKNLVKLRLNIEEGNKNALHSLVSISRGRRIPTLIKNSYNISDSMWRASGDNSQDFNFYSKRIILSKIFTRVALKFIDDESDNHQDSWNLLDKEISKIMKISTIKEKIKNSKINKAAKIACNLKENFKDLPFVRLFHKK